MPLYVDKLNVNGNPIGNYKVYTALLTQTGTDAPVATVIENTLDENLTFVRESVGRYSTNLLQYPANDKVFISVTPGTTLPVGVTLFSNYLDGVITISSYANYTGAYISSIGQNDNLLASAYLEIRVYN